MPIEARRGSAGRSRESGSSVLPSAEADGLLGTEEAVRLQLVAKKLHNHAEASKPLFSDLDES